MIYENVERVEPSGICDVHFKKLILIRENS